MKPPSLSRPSQCVSDSRVTRTWGQIEHDDSVFAALCRLYSLIVRNQTLA